MLADNLRSCDCSEGFVGGLAGVVWVGGMTGRVSLARTFNNLLKALRGAGLTPATRRRETADRAERWRRRGGGRVHRSSFLECLSGVRHVAL